ncbi:glycoside hydrolase family 6 protein [Streptomyces sp. NPDC056227]|uniref:glycoside hydrolase family 6 protein n=1 Tax=Streptomyces sp. NPDC056227 TaxID=3345753 RepID=UPI0035D9B46F
MYGDYTGRSGAGAAALAVTLLLAGCSSSSPSGGDESPAGSGPYWVNPDGNAARQVAAYTKAGNDRNAGLIKKIARQPVGEWIGPDNPEAEAQGFTEAARKAGREALLVLYNIPHRDCGQFSKGGAADGDAYRAWLENVAKGIGDRRTTVILEPDALLHLIDGCTPQEFHEERYDLFKGAVQRLQQLPHTRVYMDAGNAGWRTPDALFQPLRQAGIADADGFAVNVSNFQTTAASTDFGKRLSVKVGNKPFVIDTSRNGNGPYDEGDPKENWCNPPGRALGEPPTTDTGEDLVDAYLWIKRPGESDGACKGGPKAGEWWPEYALGLARNTK